MARRRNQQAINAKMYRHFAVVTVLLTASIAVFAEGENADATQRKSEAAVEQASPEPPTGKPKFYVASGAESGMDERKLKSFYNDAANAVSENIAQIGSIDDFIPSEVSALSRLGELGITREQFNNLSEKERADILAKLSNDTSDEARRRKQRQAAAESLRRSGGTRTSTDYEPS